MSKKMVWSIYKDTVGIEFDQWQEADAAFFFDRDIEASPDNRVKFFLDGVHTVYFDKKPFQVEVVNGKFNIQDVCRACGEAVAAADYWGVYIEGFSRKNGLFVVEIGS